MKPSAIEIDVIVSAPFMENSLIVRDPARSDCLIVDPGFQPKKIVSAMQRLRVEPALILLTHGHVDHIAGNAALRQQWPALPIVIGVNDAPLLTDPVANLSGLGGVAVTSPPADRVVREGDVVEAAGMKLHVLDIPGHSPGHVVYVLNSENPPIVIGGDVLFQGSIGRCDFPGGDQELLVSGIRAKLFTLPEGTRVYPGHGPETTVGVERRTNPFCGDRAGYFDLA